MGRVLKNGVSCRLLYTWGSFGRLDREFRRSTKDTSRRSPAWDTAVLVPMKVDYGLRVLIRTGPNAAAGRECAGRIAAEQKIPEAYRNHGLSNLQAAGMLESRRGPAGGHMLAHPASEITVADVFVSFDRSLAPLDCLDSPEECTLSGACSQRELWSDVERVLLERLRKTRVSDLVAEQREMTWAAVAG